MRAFQPYQFAVLALLMLTLGMFAIFSPFNGATNDEWSYLYAGQQGEWHGQLVNRDFAMGSAVIATHLMPDRPQNLYIIHLFFTFLISLGLFHLGKRVMGRAWLALLWAGLYVVYIPSNMDASRALFIQTYSWAILLAVISLILWTEFIHRQLISWAILAGIFGNVAARVYEGFIPLLWVLPLIIAGIFYYGRGEATGNDATKKSDSRIAPTRVFMIGWGVWYIGVGLGTADFVLPFLRGTAQYQNRVGSQESIDWLGRSQEFLTLTFPFKTEIFTTHLNYLLPALVLMGLFLLVAWRLYEAEPQFLAVQNWLMGLGLMLVLVLLSGLALIYADLYAEPRAQFLPAPFAAGLILCGIGLIAWGAWFSLRILPQISVFVLVGLWLVLGLQWSLEAQIWAAENRGPAFDQKTPFFRELQALIPDLPPNSAILYQCESPQNSLQLARLADLFGAAYLYGKDVQLILDPIHIAPLRPPILELEADSLYYAHEYDLRRVGKREFTYTYAEVVVVACDDTDIYIQEHWQSDYNPYARIEEGWLENEAVLNR